MTLKVELDQNRYHNLHRLHLVAGIEFLVVDF